MDLFTLIVMVSMVAMIVAILLLGFYHPRSGAEILQWHPTRSAELEAQNDIDDLEQMISAQNALRERHGKAARTEADVEEEVRRHRAELDDYAQRYWEEQGTKGVRPGKEDI